MNKLPGEPKYKPQDLSREELLKENALLYEEVLVARRASEITSQHVVEQFTKMNELLGTVPYMSPEQVTGDEDLDHRVDIWGVGAILYRALTGQPPYPGTKPYKVLLAILRDPVTPPREVRAEVPIELESVVCKALSKDPAERYQSAAEFRTELLAVSDELAREVRIEQLGKKREDVQRSCGQIHDRVGQIGHVGLTVVVLVPPAHRRTVALDPDTESATEN